MSDDNNISKIKPENEKEIKDFIEAFNKESERGCVLIACSYLDGLMKKILQSFFVAGRSKKLLEDFNAPIGTFAIRTSVAYALGLITEQEFKEINFLRSIRNEFAHEIRASFATGKIRDLCKNLTFTIPSSDMRTRFTFSAAAMVVSMINRPRRIAELKPTPFQVAAFRLSAVSPDQPPSAPLPPL